MMKFVLKKRLSLVLGKLYENCTEIMEKCYVRKLTSKWVISTGNHLFGQNIRYQKTMDKKKWVSLVLGKMYKNCPKINRSVILRNLLRRE